MSDSCISAVLLSHHNPWVCNCRGAFQLIPLLDYITSILGDVLEDDMSLHFEQYWNQLNATYVQSNANVDTEVYGALRTANAYIPVSHLRTPLII